MKSNYVTLRDKKGRPIFEHVMGGSACWLQPADFNEPAENRGQLFQGARKGSRVLAAKRTGAVHEVGPGAGPRAARMAAMRARMPRLL
jgi:hypothetical protein